MIAFKVERKFLKDTYCIGNLYYKTNEDWIWICNTMEPPVKDNTENTAIPTGAYKFRLAFSPEFQTRVPLLENVPERTSIEIHWGNHPKDTLGCLLVGSNVSVGELTSSYVAWKQLMEIITSNYQPEYDILFTRV